MAKTVVGLFDSFNQAQDALRDLVASGFARDDISIVATEETAGRYAGKQPGEPGSDTPGDAAEGAAAGAGVGATTGAVVGGAAGLLAGLGAFAIPGFGPLLAAGPIVALLTGAGIGAGVGAVAGGLIGALTNAGVPEEQAEIYAEGVRRGGTLLTVDAADSMAPNAAEIMDRHGAVDIDQRATTLGQSAGGAASTTPMTTAPGVVPAVTPGRGAGMSEEDRRRLAEERVRTGEQRPQGRVRIYTRQDQLRDQQRLQQGTTMRPDQQQGPTDMGAH